MSSIFKIYRPSKAVTQSGLGNTKFWHLKCESSNSYYIDPIMGWIGSKDPKKQIVLKFSSLEQAISYARRCHATYIIDMPNSIKKLPKSYDDNFK